MAWHNFALDMQTKIGISKAKYLGKIVILAVSKQAITQFYKQGNNIYSKMSTVTEIHIMRSLEKG